MKNYYLLLLLFTFLFSACSDDEDKNDKENSISINCNIKYENKDNELTVDEGANIFVFLNQTLANIDEYKTNGTIILKDGKEIEYDYDGVVKNDGFAIINGVNGEYTNYVIYVESKEFSGLIKGFDLLNSTLDTYSITHTFKYSDLIKKKLQGKKWAGCGSSSTEALNINDPVTGDKLGYVELIGKRNQMEYYNYGVGGGYLSYKPKHYYCFSNTDENAKYKQPTYKQLPKDLDYITIWFGGNDSWYSGSQNDSNVGTIDDNINTTFYGAYNIVIDYLKKKYPDAKIGIVVTHGATAAYRQANRDIAKKWNIGCLDLIGGDNPIWIEKEPESNFDKSILAARKKEFTYDGQHPNKAGYEYLANIIEEWLYTL